MTQQDDDKLLAEIEKRHDELEKRTFRYEDFRWAHADRAALLAIVRRQQSEITSLTGQCASYRESFAGAVTVNDHLREREAALRSAMEHISTAGDIAMPYANWEPTMQLAMDELAMVKKTARKALAAGGNDE